ncbi:MAG: hypothetical protein J6B04_03220, partial [Clostridia bacterium]|nr:hypothetical protein [Clostridia bacterium]
LGHAPVKTEAKAATCSEAGYEAYWTCENCNKLFSDEACESEIQAPVEIPVTCTSKCEICGKCEDSECTESVCAGKCPGHASSGGDFSTDTEYPEGGTFQPLN